MIAGWNESRFLFLLTRTFARPRQMHLIHQRLNIVKTVGVSDNGDSMDFFLDPSDGAFIEKYLENKKMSNNRLIGIHPFGSVQSKSWINYPAFLALVRKELPDYAFVIMGGTREAADPTARHPIGAEDDHRMFWTVGELSLGRSAALMQRYSCLLTTDSGPMQMALALKIPTVVLAGPTDMKRTGPLDQTRNDIIQKAVPCRPCDLKTCGLHACMDSIPIREIVNAVKNLLARSGSLQNHSMKPFLSAISATTPS